MKARSINLAPDAHDVGGAAGSAAGSASVHLKLNITSHPANLREARLAVESLCRRRGTPQKVLEDVGLCLNEALANVIRHAYGGATDRPIEIDASCDDHQVRIRIRDWGAPVDPALLAAPVQRKDPLTPGGLGLICLRELMDAVEFAPQRPAGTLLTMTRSTRRP